MKSLILITFLSLSVSVFGATVEATRAAKKYMEDKIKAGTLSIQDLDKNFTLGSDTFNYSQFGDLADGLIKKNFKEMGKDDTRQFFQNYLTSRTAFLKDSEAYRNECVESKQVCDERQKQRSFTLTIINSLYQEMEKTKVSFFDSNMCTFKANLIPNEEFWSQFVEFNKNKDECAPLGVNEQRYVRKNEHQQDYLIRKTANNKNQIVLNLDFAYESGGLSSTEMMNRVRGCLKDANPFLGTDDNQLEIVALSPAEVRRDKSLGQLRPAKINLEGPNFRSHSASYSDVADCTTIVHETMHLLGLCDEYPERDLSLFDASCRIITTQDSIMRNKDNALSRSQEKTMDCSCEASSNCGKIMNSTNELAKSIYLGESDNELLDGWFKSDYCKFEGFTPITPTDDKAVVMKSEDAVNNEFSIGVRTVGTHPGGQVFFNEAKVTCKFAPYSFTPSELHAEELQRFNTSKELIKQRIAKNPRRGICPRDAKELKSKNKIEGAPGATLTAGVLTIRKPSEGSMLSPNHVSRILAGSCESKAMNYRKCAELGYEGLKESSCNQAVRASCSEDTFLNRSADPQ